MENFIDRKKELEYLENEYQSNRSFLGGIFLLKQNRKYRPRNININGRLFCYSKFFQHSFFINKEISFKLSLL